MSNNRAELDQKMAEIIEYFPLLWAGLYKGMISEGFTEEQALFLLKTYIEAMADKK